MIVHVLLMLLFSADLAAWQTVLYGIGMLLGGAIVNIAVTMLVFRWQRDNLAFRMTRLEQAFVAHTGITLNGKDYTKER